MYLKTGGMTLGAEKIDCEAFDLIQEVHDEIVQAAETVGADKLKPIKDAVSDNITYSQIKCSLLMLKTDTLSQK